MATVTRSFAPTDYIEALPAPAADINCASGQYAALLAMFDALPYTRKVDCGADSGGTNHVWEYGFGNPDGIPILLDSCMHGSEVQAVAVSYWIAHCVANRLGSLGRWLADRCDVRVIPFLNPGGFIGGTYTNSAGVNLNRNFAPFHKHYDCTATQSGAGSAFDLFETVSSSGGATGIVTLVQSSTLYISTTSGTFVTGEAISGEDRGARGVASMSNPTIAPILATETPGAAAADQAESAILIARLTAPTGLVPPMYYVNGHTNGSATAKQVSVAGPNCQLEGNSGTLARSVLLANHVVSRLDAAASVGYYGTQSLGLNATGMAVNYAAYAGLVGTAIYDSNAASWGAAAYYADAGYVQQHATWIALWVRLSIEQGKDNTDRRSIVSVDLYGGDADGVLSTTCTTAYGEDATKSGQVRADSRGLYRWTPKYTASDVITPLSMIHLLRTSDVILTVEQGDIGVTDTARTIKASTWLEAQGSVGYANALASGEGPSYTAWVDASVVGKYYPLPRRAVVYRNVPAGWYQAVLAFWLSGAATLQVRYPMLRVTVIPSGNPLPWAYLTT